MVISRLTSGRIDCSKTRRESIEMARRPATLQNDGERWDERINAEMGIPVRSKENTFGADQCQGVVLAGLVKPATSDGCREAVKGSLLQPQYWRPISPTMRTAPARSNCQTRFIAAKSWSSSEGPAGRSKRRLYRAYRLGDGARSKRRRDAMAHPTFTTTR